MIQRKQTVFLAIAAAFQVTMFFFPLAKFIGDQDSLILYVYKLISLVPDHSPAFPALLIMIFAFLSIAIILLAVAAIFLYKKRRLQLTLTKIAIMLNLVIIASFFFYFVNALEIAAGGLVKYSTGTYLPLASLLFLMLAYRGIISDERLLRSAERLR